MSKFKWTPRKRRAAYLLACEPKKYKDIAAELNITEQTLWNYRQAAEFNREVGKFISHLSYLSFGIGLFSWWGVKQTIWLAKQGISMPDIQQLHLGGADVWIFMGVILFVISQIFKRGIEIQEENDLTV